MTECLKCGGSRLREYRYGCEHVMLGEDAPMPADVFRFSSRRGEMLWMAEGAAFTSAPLLIAHATEPSEAAEAMAALERLGGRWASVFSGTVEIVEPQGHRFTAEHPTREGAVALWQERWRWGRFIDALFATLTRWAREGEERRLLRLMESDEFVEEVARELSGGMREKWAREGEAMRSRARIDAAITTAVIGCDEGVERGHVLVRTPDGKVRPAGEASRHAWRRYFLRDDLATMQRDREWAREEIAEYLGALGAVSHDTSEAIMIKLSDGGIRVDGVHASFDADGDRVSTLTLLRDCDGVWTGTVRR